MTERSADGVAGGTLLTQEELDDLIPDTVKAQSQLNEWEQVNIQEAEAWAFSRRRGDWHRIKFISTLHKRMFKNVWKWAGTFRRSDKNIGAVHWTDITTNLQQLCDDGAYWSDNETYSIDEIAARIHHRLTQIHPFPNGNGRHARMMADLILHSAGADRFSWGGGPGRTGDDEIRQSYITALRAADGGDYQALFDFVRS